MARQLAGVQSLVLRGVEASVEETGVKNDVTNDIQCLIVPDCASQPGSAAGLGEQ